MNHFHVRVCSLLSLLFVPSLCYSSNNPNPLLIKTDPASAETSASEILAHELVELLKMDKRAIFGESTLGNTAETAAKVAAVARLTAKAWLVVPTVADQA